MNGLIFISITLLLGWSLNAAVETNPASGAIPADSLPAFKTDSSKSSVVKSIESGNTGQKLGTQNHNSLDSLEKKMRQRKPYVGISLGIAFGDMSAKKRFDAQLQNDLSRDSSLQILQPYDPVHIFFPMGFLAAFPLFTYLDVCVRSEHFWYQMQALAQGRSQAKEYRYALSGQLIGFGARYLIPASQFSVTGHSGLYLAYTHFWSFFPTEIYNQFGSISAKWNPSGVGYEIQAGFQQDFEKRWTLIGGLAFSDIRFKSSDSWHKILPGDFQDNAQWGLKSLRINVQGLFQFGIPSHSRNF